MGQRLLDDNSFPGVPDDNGVTYLVDDNGDWLGEEPDPRQVPLPQACM